jgi:hypothetical protein
MTSIIAAPLLAMLVRSGAESRNLTPTSATVKLA